MTIRENITLPGLWNYTVCAVDKPPERSEAGRDQVQSLKVKTPGIKARVMNLSGGNQQKVVLGKWLALKPKVLIVDEPTRGIDVSAKAEIYRLLRELADSGVAIIAISSDLEEVLGISDRIAVMREGTIVGLLDRKQFSEEAVMNLAFGRKTAADRARSPGRRFWRPNEEKGILDFPVAGRSFRLHGVEGAPFSGSLQHQQHVRAGGHLWNHEPGSRIRHHHRRNRPDDRRDLLAAAGAAPAFLVGFDVQWGSYHIHINPMPWPVGCLLSIVCITVLGLIHALLIAKLRCRRSS